MSEKKCDHDFEVVYSYGPRALLCCNVCEKNFYMLLGDGGYSLEEIVEEKK